MTQNKEMKTVRINKLLHQQLKLYIAEENVKTGGAENLASLLEKVIKEYIKKEKAVKIA